MKIKSWQIALTVIVVIFGGTMLSGMFGLMGEEDEKTPARYESGEYDPYDIRGSYTFGEISEFFSIDIDVLSEAFGVTGDMQTKDLESLYGEEEMEIGNSSVQLFVAIYNGIEPLYDEQYFPVSAVTVLKRDVDLDEDTLSYLESHQIDTEPVISDVEAEEGEYEEALIKGNTTFGQLLDYGIKKEEIEEIIGAEMPAAAETVRNYCTSNGLTFSDIKYKLESLIE